METLLKIFDRVKQVEGIDSDYKLAKSLNTTGANISKWKSKSKIPYDVLHEYCNSSGVSIEWVLNGEGPVYRKELNLSEEVDRLKDENKTLKDDLKKMDDFLDLVEERRSRNRRDPLPGVEGT